VADHLSIGEVLGLLQDEFPDVTISKIRFLESQGLIDPERTPSGYRKFYGPDIDRLRWILTQQRENFLPLKVIKDRLRDPDFSTGGENGGTVPPIVSTPPTTGNPTAGTPTTVRASMPAGEAPEPIWMADLARSTRDRPNAVEAPPARAMKEAPTRPADIVDQDVSLTGAELAAAAEISSDDLAELVRYGLVVGRPMGEDVYYDGDCLVVARKAAAFFAHGVGARHLRMFKVSAEREAGFLEQVAMPLLKQRNPESRRQAVDLVEELADLGHDLRAALLRANLRQHLTQR